MSKFGVEARESAHRNNPCASILAVFILSMKKLKSASSHAQMPVNENTGHSLFERRLTKKKLIQCLEWGIHCDNYPLTTPFKSDYKVHQNMGIKVKLNPSPPPPPPASCQPSTKNLVEKEGCDDLFTSFARLSSDLFPVWVVEIKNIWKVLEYRGFVRLWFST